MTVDYYTRKPTVNFPVNQKMFNVLLELLSDIEHNSSKESYKEKAHDIKDNILRYSYNKRANDIVSIVDIGLYPKEAKDLIVFMLEKYENSITPSDDYTKYLKRK